MDPRRTPKHINITTNPASFDTMEIDLSYIRTIPQKDTNRCWMICAISEPLSRFRMETGLTDFELSLNYIAFWDCVEKCSLFFENIILTRNLPVGSDAVQRILRFGIDDGGDWVNAAEVITKYGVVPEEAMPETNASADPGEVFLFIERYARHIALQIRAAEDNYSIGSIKESALQMIYGYLAENFGKPPAVVELQPRLREKMAVAETHISPRKLADLILGDSLLHQYSFVSVDSAFTPMNTKFVFPYNGYHVLTPHAEYINIGFRELKAKILYQLQDGKAVPIACDTRYCQKPENRIFDLQRHSHELAFPIDRKRGFDVQLLRINHCMLIVGVKEQCDGSLLWKIANSWAANPDEFYYATDSWFDTFVFEAVIAQQFCGYMNYPECEMLPDSVIL